jgi:hypothetical protein
MLVAVLALSGCRPVVCECEETAITDPCTNSFAVFPAANATDVYYRTTVEASFDTPEDAAVIAVAGVGGVAAWRGNNLVFTPTDPLVPGTTYVASVTFSCGTSEWSFTTGEVGAPVAADLTGRAWALDVAAGRPLSPMAGLAQAWIPGTLLLGVRGVDARALDAVAAYAADDSEPRQDVCRPSIPLPGARLAADPWFDVGPGPVTLDARVALRLDAFELEGAFAPDLAYVQGAVLQGVVDTRQMAPYLDEDGPDTAVCDMLAGMGDACVPCADGSGVYCAPFIIDGIDGPRIDGAIQTLTDSTIDCTNPECAGTPACP